MASAMYSQCTMWNGSAHLLAATMFWTPGDRRSSGDDTLSRGSEVGCLLTSRLGRCAPWYGAIFRSLPSSARGLEPAVRGRGRPVGVPGRRRACRLYETRARRFPGLGGGPVRSSLGASWKLPGCFLLYGFRLSLLYGFRDATAPPVPKIDGSYKKQHLDVSRTS